MAKKNKKMESNEECENCCNHNCNGYGWKCGGGGAYFLGFLGAAIFYIQQATGFWSGVLGVLKAIVWPAFVVYKLLGL